MTDFVGAKIWTDGTNVYYSDENKGQYQLDKTTATWNPKTWNGFATLDGANGPWTDGENIYYSFSTLQYQLDKTTSTWTQKTWGGLTNFYGYGVWTDGENIYYSFDYNQYQLDKTTFTWTKKPGMG